MLSSFSVRTFSARLSSQLQVICCKIKKAEFATLNFNDHQAAFCGRSTLELLRASVVFKICSIQPIISNSTKLFNLSNRVFGKFLTNAVIRRTFFAQFIGGEDEHDIKGVTEKLKTLGVGSILDYAAEADVNVPNLTIDSNGVECRQFDTNIEEVECEANVKIFLRCIDAAAQSPGGFAALKVTALGRPVLLERMTEIIQCVQKLFKKFDKQLIREINNSEFSSTLDELGIEMSQNEKLKLFNRFDLSGSGKIDAHDWTEYLRIEDLQFRPFFTNSSNKSEKCILPCLSSEELKMFEAMVGRLNKVATYAAERKVRLMVDAEQTYFQPAIDHMVVLLQRQFNRDFPAIFGTYQAYLKDIYRQLKTDIDRARRENFQFACKLVRGAYLTSERDRANNLGYADPIQDSVEDTHQSYHSCMDLLFQNIDIANIMIASHNQRSVEYAAELMEKLSVDRKTGGIFFGQLLGMSDNLSFTLGLNGFNAFKYVPYGKIQEVIPYLIRRAEESSAFGGLAKIQQVMIIEELKRRFGISKFKFLKSR